DNPDFADEIRYKGQILQEELSKMVAKYPQLDMDLRGRGMIWGLDIPRPGFAGEVSRLAFANRLVIELAGADDNVVKFLPALTIEEDLLRQGLEIIDRVIGELMESKAHSFGGSH
ncbi:MAG: aminotransferase class III-fold pyridoxal phosphate-dependent enzyme, partial [Gammaproteobacteria bacterium]|nr:aminotransferase class III-fold pyridoxal phosphate-dependent enzyme [Gammaproteobacteria bacterium]